MSRGRRIPWRVLAWALVLLYLAAVVGLGAYKVAGGRPLGPARALVPAPLRLLIIYDPQIAPWLLEVAERYAATAPRVHGRPVVLELRPLRSGPAMRALLDGRVQPDAWLPASSLWVRALNAEWEQRFGGPIIAEAGTAGLPPVRPLLHSPLVLVGRAEETARLAQGDSIPWDALQPRARSAFVLWSSPLVEDSSLAGLVLAAHSYYRRSGGLRPADVANPAFQRWLAGLVHGSVVATGVPPTRVEAALERLLAPGGGTPPTTGTALLALADEQRALEAAASATEAGGRLYYPPLNLPADYPLAPLWATWVTTDARLALQDLAAFLLAPSQQQRALAAGFRPASPGVPLDTDELSSRFGAGTRLGLRPAIGPVVELPDGQVLKDLLQLWSRLGRER